MDSIDLLNKINNYSKNKIVNLIELKYFIDNTSKKEFEQIIFIGKFLKGMLSILTGNKASKSDKIKLMPEYTKNITDLTDILKLIASKNITDKNFSIEYFQTKFFDLNQSSMQNFTTLISDLSICKDYFNELRDK